MVFLLTNKRKILKKTFPLPIFFSSSPLPINFRRLALSDRLADFFFFPLDSVLSLLYLLQGLQRESKDCKKDHYKNKTRKPNNTKMPSLVSVTISLKQIRRLRWCFEIPRASISQDKTGVEWSTKALCRHSGELMMCLRYHQQKDEGRKNPRLNNLFFLLFFLKYPNNLYIEERLDLLECQTFWLPKRLEFRNKLFIECH